MIKFGFSIVLLSCCFLQLTTGYFMENRIGVETVEDQFKPISADESPVEDVSDTKYASVEDVSNNNEEEQYVTAPKEDEELEDDEDSELQTFDKDQRSVEKRANPTVVRACRLREHGLRRSCSKKISVMCRKSYCVRYRICGVCSKKDCGLYKSITDGKLICKCSTKCNQLDIDPLKIYRTLYYKYE